MALTSRPLAAEDNLTDLLDKDDADALPLDDLLFLDLMDAVVLTAIDLSLVLVSSWPLLIGVGILEDRLFAPFVLLVRGGRLGLLLLIFHHHHPRPNFILGPFDHPRNAFLLLDGLFFSVRQRDGPFDP
eukprot:CAMPEP_0181129336 /NCGR_PEP_ID=MMETSP1071-20121207/29266_1 /TAXON_ID=35127 /ORGANISM="Thalassiosira sp., Strain NH16" /LENGTH=128 /DNA_ID=CAMNT_0023215313 /DNA_START=363 /DNA_END=746 /DNA_ORIENTATION=-